MKIVFQCLKCSNTTNYLNSFTLDYCGAACYALRNSFSCYRVILGRPFSRSPNDFLKENYRWSKSVPIITRPFLTFHSMSQNVHFDLSTYSRNVTVLSANTKICFSISRYLPKHYRKTLTNKYNTMVKVYS